MKMTNITKAEGGYKVEGSSDTYATLKDAVRFIKAKEQAKKKAEKGNTKTDGEGRRFYSEKLDRYFRSNWEIELAELLTELGIEWEYEIKRYYFRAERDSYLPDIYLPEYNVWIEVKGWLDKKSYRKITLFKKYHAKDYGFFLYMKDDRELILKNPQAIYAYISIAQEEQERSKRK